MNDGESSTVPTGGATVPTGRPVVPTGGFAASSSSITSKQNKPPPKRFIKSQIPDSILSDPTLNAAISLLPKAYNFEVHKTVARLRSSGARRAALQLPDGLLMYSLTLADIFLKSSPSLEDVIVLAEPTYGACCVDDFAAAALSADLLIHYGHSCLFPVPSSRLPVLYVFVDIQIDADRIAAAIKSNFPSKTKLAMAGTVQFISAVHLAKSELVSDGYDILIPQAKPLSAGEVLGCTAPTIPKSKGIETAVFVADGRFHLEAFMIANPKIKTFRFDPFLGVLVLEEYDHEGMKNARKEAILLARKAKNWGIILGTLGRQGSTRVLDRIVGMMEERGMDYTVVLMSEISPSRIELFGDSIDAWVQIACPRLSIDWGEGFSKPVLTTFEFEVALGLITGWWEKKRENEGFCGDCCSSCSCDEGCYPMDYYAQDGGDWNSSYAKKKPLAGEGKQQRYRSNEIRT